MFAEENLESAAKTSMQNTIQSDVQMKTVETPLFDHNVATCSWKSKGSIPGNSLNIDNISNGSLK